MSNDPAHPAPGHEPGGRHEPGTPDESGHSQGPPPPHEPGPPRESGHDGARPVPRYGQYIDSGQTPEYGMGRSPQYGVGHSPQYGTAPGTAPGGARGGIRGGARAGTRGRLARSGMPVTWTIIIVCTAVWALQWLTYLLTPYNLASMLGYAPVLTFDQPWRMLTTALVHSMPSPLHLLLNMYTFYLFGRMLEPLLGTWRMLTLFVLSVLGGSIGVLLLSPPGVLVIGASGGVFGLFGAAFVYMRHFKQNLTPMIVLIAINLVFGFVVGGIAWQAHVGGLVAGALVAFALLPGLRRRGHA